MGHQIKYLVMDVDGTLTDGKIYMGENGEMFKVFDIKDGYGIKELLPQHGIIPVIITARESKILENRCKELNISILYQGIRNKLDKLQKLIIEYNDINETDIGLKNCAYIGDDLLDLQCMDPIKAAGGLVGCPSDAVEKVKEIACYVSEYKGGEGAVRDFIEWLVEQEGL